MEFQKFFPVDTTSCQVIDMSIAIEVIMKEKIESYEGAVQILPILVAIHFLNMCIIKN